MYYKPVKNGSFANSSYELCIIPDDDALFLVGPLAMRLLAYGFPVRFNPYPENRITTVSVYCTGDQFIGIKNQLRFEKVQLPGGANGK